jgi:hypothetical protein
MKHMYIQKIDNFYGNNEKYLESFLIQQVLCRWWEPFCEFMFCKDCCINVSYEKLWIHKKDIVLWMSSQQSCQSCWWMLDFVYLNEVFKTEIINYFRFNVQCILLLWEHDGVEGFCILVKKNILELLDYEFSLRWWYDSWKVLQKLLELWVSQDQQMICLHHIYISEASRWNRFAQRMLEQGIKNIWYKEHLPIIMETHKDSQFVWLAKKLGFWGTWVKDESWYEIYHHPSQKTMRFRN